MILVTEIEIETTPWTDTRTTYMPSSNRQDTRDDSRQSMDNDTIPENVGLNNKTDRFDLSHLAMTGDKTAKT